MTLITDNTAIRDFCAEASSSTYVTVDTEFLRDKTYWPILCVIQIAGDNGAVAIDPLADGVDLEPVYDLMANEKVLKVFHAARQDVEIFFQKSGKIPHPLFDTQVAAMVCGFGDSVGFETLAMKLAGTAIDKSMRFTDWSQRPLNEKQIAYALSDVIHLRPIYEALRDKLGNNSRSHWLEEEMAVLTSPKTYDLHPEDSWKRLKLRTTKPRFLAIVRELAAWREEEAQRRDQPRGRILKDDALLNIATQAPSSNDELSRARSFPKGMIGKPSGEAILQAIAKGKKCPREDCPSPLEKPEIPGSARPLIDLLKVLLKTKCESHGVAQKLVANSADLDLIAINDTADVAALSGWRRELFGEDALALKRGELALTVKNNEVQVVRT